MTVSFGKGKWLKISQKGYHGIEDPVSFPSSSRRIVVTFSFWGRRILGETEGLQDFYPRVFDLHPRKPSAWYRGEISKCFLLI